VNRTLKEVLWLGAIIVVPGLGLALIVKKLYTDLDSNQEFREHVRKNYGEGSKYEYDTRNL
jgi:hypothetical protein